jgi:3-phosphoshikimate 1-carboxyvinyltransferase
MSATSLARPIVPLSSRNPQPFVANIPGSKSFTNRALILAAQRQGTTLIEGALHAQDTDGLADCLGQFGGLETEKTETGYRVTRSTPKLTAPSQELYIGAAGTPARLLLTFAAAAENATVITGTPRLCERPMGDILESLGQLGIRYDCLQTPGCLPVRIYGSEVMTRDWSVAGNISSQFVSSLLLFAAQQPGSAPVMVRVLGHLVSRPYVEMTVQAMQDCGIQVEEIAAQVWRVTPGAAQIDRIQVEADASSMSYFLAAAALTQTQVVIPRIGCHSIQGDVGFAKVLQVMGCSVQLNDKTIELEGRPLQGIEVDMEAMPDVVLTLAVVAAHAKGSTQIKNVANLRVKECDRIQAAVTELQRLGVTVEEGQDWFTVHPTENLTEKITPAQTDTYTETYIETYEDHRVAMAFSLMGLLHEGVIITDPDCVGKSFPGFWQEFDRFSAHHGLSCSK